MKSTVTTARTLAAEWGVKLLQRLTYSAHEKRYRGRSQPNVILGTVTSKPGRIVAVQGFPWPLPSALPPLSRRHVCIAMALKSLAALLLLILLASPSAEAVRPLQRARDLVEGKARFRSSPAPCDGVCLQSLSAETLRTASPLAEDDQARSRSHAGAGAHGVLDHARSSNG